VEQAVEVVLCVDGSDADHYVCEVQSRPMMPNSDKARETVEVGNGKA